MHDDVNRSYHSCDVCHKTIPKGKITRNPPVTVPLIDVPFKRVAIDLIVPITSQSEDGHKYILTLVDYATRYPESIPQTNITSVNVVEGLVDIYCRFEVPDEILTYLGTQFTSECMREVSRLLKIKQLRLSLPSHV